MYVIIYAHTYYATPKIRRPKINFRANLCAIMLPMATYLKRSPDKYFWWVFLAGVAASLIGSLFYDVPSHVPYSGAIRLLTAGALIGIIAITIVRAVSRSR